MARCEVCGNDYDKAFTLTTVDGTTHTFDSFECAVHAVAPACQHCGCRIIGHGVEVDGSLFCCAHCARESGVSGVKDRAGGATEEHRTVLEEQEGLPATRPPSES